jgi:hypothetical protein
MLDPGDADGGPKDTNRTVARRPRPIADGTKAVEPGSPETAIGLQDQGVPTPGRDRGDRIEDLDRTCVTGLCAIADLAGVLVTPGPESTRGVDGEAVLSTARDPPNQLPSSSFGHPLQIGSGIDRVRLRCRIDREQMGRRRRIRKGLANPEGCDERARKESDASLVE